MYLNFIHMLKELPNSDGDKGCPRRSEGSPGTLLLNIQMRGIPHD